MIGKDFIVVVYMFIAGAMLLPILVYALSKKKPRLAYLFGGVACFLIGIFVLIFSIKVNDVTLAIKGAPIIARQSHPLGFYLAMIWNIAAGSFMIAVGYWLTKRGLMEKMRVETKDVGAQQ